MPRQTKREKEARNRALHVLARMRRTGETLTAAAREEGIDPRTVRHYVGADLRRLHDEEKILPTMADRRNRHMFVPTVRGATPVVVHGSEQASLLGRYLSAVGLYLRKGNMDSLAEFEGQSIGGYPLITDPDTLTELAQAGALQQWQEGQIEPAIQ
jgi:hypothetical protein